MPKPASMKLFDALYLGSIAVGLIGVALVWDGLVAQMMEEFAAQGLDSSEATASATLIGGFAFGIAINLVLWFVISVLRIAFVKWVLILFLVWGIFGILVGLSEAPFGLQQVTGLVSTLMSCAAIYYLFQPDAKEWLAQKRGQ